MRERLDAAEQLLNQGKHDEATREFDWLWHNMARLEPDMAGVRVSFMAKSIGQLVEKHRPARARFAEIRDRSERLADADIDTNAELRFDWIVLNEVLSQPERTLTWFDGVKDNARYATLLDRVATRLVPLLRASGRLADIGRLYQDPVALIRRTHVNFQPPPDLAPDEMPPVMRQALQKILDDLPKHVIEEAALLVASLLAAGRSADADAVEREARRLDPSEAMRAALQKARGKLD
jgi:hypothetical protein